jgi:hypothetical protein
MVRFAIWLVLGVLLAACSPPPAGQLWKTTLPNGEAASLPVVLRDETGLVTSIEPLAVDPSGVGSMPSVQADPNDPNALLVTWLGGCDTDAQLGLKPSHRGTGQYDLHVSFGSPSGFGGGCAAVGVGRGVRVRTSSPIPVDSIAVNAAGP